MESQTNIITEKIKTLFEFEVLNSEILNLYKYIERGFNSEKHKKVLILKRKEIKQITEKLKELKIYYFLDRNSFLKNNPLNSNEIQKEVAKRSYTY